MERPKQIKKFIPEFKKEKDLEQMKVIGISKFKSEREFVEKEIDP